MLNLDENQAVQLYICNLHFSPEQLGSSGWKLKKNAFPDRINNEEVDVELDDDDPTNLAVSPAKKFKSNEIEKVKLLF